MGATSASAENNTNSKSGSESHNAFAFWCIGLPVTGALSALIYFKVETPIRDRGLVKRGTKAPM